MNPFLSELKKQSDLAGFDTRKIATGDYITPGMTDEDRRKLRAKYSTDPLRPYIGDPICISVEEA